MIRAARLLHLRRLRRHPVRSVIAVVSVASGVALAVAVTVVQTSTSRSFDDYANSFAGPAPLRVIGPIDRGGLPESVVDRVRQVDGVGAAVPLVQAVTLADGPTERDIPIVALGYDCSVRALVGDFACSPEAIAGATSYRAPLMSTSLAKRLGRDGVIRSNLGPKSARGALAVDALDELNNGNVVAFPIHVAQALYTRAERVDVVYVIPDEGTDSATLKARIQRAVGAQDTVLLADEPSPQFQFIGQLYVLLALVGLGTLATGGVLAHNALALSLEDRRRDLAVATAIGGKPRTIIGGALAEGAVLGLFGGLVGALVGIGIAYPVLDSFQFLTERLTGLTMTVHITAIPFVTGAVLGALLGLLAAIRPARRASRLDVVAELQGRAAPESASRASIRRPVVVLALGLTGMVLTIVASRDGALQPWQPILAQPAALLSVAAFMSAVGQFAPFALRLGARLTRRRSTPTRLAWANLVGEGWRSASMVLAAGGAIAAAFMIANMGRMVVDGLAESTARSVRGSVVVTTIPLSNNFNLEAKASPDLIRRIEEIPGTGAIRRGAYVSVAASGEILAAEGGGERMPPHQLIRGKADQSAFARGEVLIGPGLARRDGVQPGDDIRIPGIHGFTEVRVQGIVANGDTTGLEVSMPMSLLERIWGPQPTASLTVEPKPGVSTAELASRIEAANLDPHLNALDETELLAELANENARFFAPFWALQRALVVIAFAAVLSNLLLVALRRQRELGLVAAVGMSSQQLARMVVMEAAAIGVVAVLLGTVFALGATESFRHVLNIMIPYPMPLRLDVAAPFAYGGITMLVLLAAASWPAWRTSRLNVVEALRYE